jgi:tetratricopeptide (TPR) repeat protein
LGALHPHDREDIVTALRHHRLGLLAAVAVIGVAVAATPDTVTAVPMDNSPAPFVTQSSGSARAARTTAAPTKKAKKAKKARQKRTPTAQKTSSVPEVVPGYRAAYDLVYNKQDYAGGIAKLRSLGRDDHSDVATMIGFASRKLGRYDDAKSWYDKALAADPGNARTLSYYGMWHAEQGNKLKATDFLDKVASACGNSTCREYAELKAVIGGARIY